jgi:hypothetical protein
LLQAPKENEQLAEMLRRPADRQCAQRAQWRFHKIAR